MADRTITEPARIDSRAAAQAADEADPLGWLRSRFALPDSLIYLDGNSLGALPVAVPAAVADAVTRQWGRDLITSWEDNGWWELPRRVGDKIGALIGAAPGQVICGDSTSIQLFQALTALARLRPQRSVLITDPGGFPTDQYLAESVARMAGLTLRKVSPAQLPDALDPNTAIVAFGAVDYRSGERWDSELITTATHRAGALMLWDLCHAAGVVPFELDSLDADAAVGCTYKYLNGGPGSPAWLYLNRRLQPDAELPLTGWQGHAAPFAMRGDYAPAEGIQRARIGTPPVLQMIALDAALSIYEEVSVAALRAKSLALTALAMDLADRRVPEAKIATPRPAARRGSQVALRLEHAYEITQALIARGVIGDFRAPDVLRLGFAPAYLTFTQVWDAFDALRGVLDEQAWRDPRFAAGQRTVT